jgi:hypothetical protein
VPGVPEADEMDRCPLDLPERQETRRPGCPQEREDHQHREERQMKRPWWLKSRRRRSAEKRAALIRPITERAKRRKANGQK